MTSPQGWYPDPAGGAGLRWYDGEQWTGYAAPPAPGPSAAALLAIPDGRPLAGWGSRLGAYVIDSLVVGVVATALGIPWWIQVVREYVAFLDELTSAAEAGRTSSTDSLDLYAEIAGPLVVLTLITLLVGLVYHAAQLRLRSSTLGMRAVGIEVRTWEPLHDRLPWRVVLLRWATFYGVGILAVVPLAGTFVSLYIILAGLWPLWDKRRQGLHDKAAGTVVVRSRA